MSKFKNKTAFLADSGSGTGQTVVQAYLTGGNKVIFLAMNKAAEQLSIAKIRQAKEKAFPAETKSLNYYKKTTFFVLFCSYFLYICTIVILIASIRFII